MQTRDLRTLLSWRQIVAQIEKDLESDQQDLRDCARELLEGLDRAISRLEREPNGADTPAHS